MHASFEYSNLELWLYEHVKESQGLGGFKRPELAAWYTAVMHVA